MGPEEGRSGSSTQAVRHGCSGNLGKTKIFKLHHISINPSQLFFSQEDGSPWPTGPCVEAHLSTMVNPALLMNIMFIVLKHFTYRQGLLVTLCSSIYTVSSVRKISGRHHDLIQLKCVLGFTRVARSLAFYVVFCRSLFVFLSFFFWPLYCLSFSDLRFLIAHLVSSCLTYRCSLYSMCVFNVLDMSLLVARASFSSCISALHEPTIQLN